MSSQGLGLLNLKQQVVAARCLQQLHSQLFNERWKEKLTQFSFHFISSCCSDRANIGRKKLLGGIWVYSQRGTNMCYLQVSKGNIFHNDVSNKTKLKNPFC